MPLVSGDSGVQEVNRQQTSFTSHKVDWNFGGRTPQPEFLGMTRQPRHPQWLHHWAHYLYWIEFNRIWHWMEWNWTSFLSGESHVTNICADSVQSCTTLVNHQWW